MTVTQPAPWTPSVDDRYLTELSKGGLHIISTQETIASGHHACWELGQGRTTAGVEAEIMANNPSFTPGNAKTTVMAAIHAYCPQYSG